MPAIVRDFSSISVFIGAGLHDPVVNLDQPEQLRVMLEAGGADVTIHWQEAGHELVSEDLDSARAWLGEK